MQLDPNGAVFQHAKAMGFVDPDKMSDGQLQEVVLDLAGALPPPPASPFTQQTDDFKKRAAADAADRAFANGLVTKVAKAMKAAASAFQAQNDLRFARMVANLHSVIPGPPDTAADLEWDRLNTLSRNLFLYGEAVSPGWTGNIGQPNHETQAALLERLKSSYPDADAAVNAAKVQ